MRDPLAEASFFALLAMIAFMRAAELWAALKTADRRATAPGSGRLSPFHDDEVRDG